MVTRSAVKWIETIGQFLRRSIIDRTIVTLWLLVTLYQSSADRRIRPIVVPMVKGIRNWPYISSLIDGGNQIMCLMDGY